MHHHACSLFFIYLFLKHKPKKKTLICTVLMGFDGSAIDSSTEASYSNCCLLFSSFRKGGCTVFLTLVHYTNSTT
ncbi:Uncharacterized protein TCM_041424 [Theobroma cacao]|uniref:Uncharacterized protein n=1 Tax=Theobroma cacao TaxID=3641 RepID=A0A061GUB7_THECC|nr:Uncharacterized protein TCM_041424 [Theobroma cacao]